MPLLLIANQKGGVGKTTTSINMIQHLPITFVVDADQHKGISKLLKVTGRSDITCVCPESETEMKDILKARSQSKEWTLIDAGGFDSNLTRQCIVYASRFGAIITPSSDDIVDQLGLIEFNKTLSNLSDMLGMEIVSNVLPSRIHHARNSVSLDLSKLNNLKLMDEIIPESAKVKHASAQGVGVKDGNLAYRYSKVAKKIGELINE